MFKSDFQLMDFALKWAGSLIPEDVQGFMILKIGDNKTLIKGK